MEAVVAELGHRDTLNMQCMAFTDVAASVGFAAAVTVTVSTINWCTSAILYAEHSH